MTVDITNGTKTREIHFAPVYPETVVKLRRLKRFIAIYQNDECVDLAHRDEYLDDVLAKLKIAGNPKVIIE